MSKKTKNVAKATEQETQEVQVEQQETQEVQVEQQETQEVQVEQQETQVEQQETQEEKQAQKTAEEIAAEKEAKYLAAVEKANELRPTVLNHKCKVVPFNTIDWVDGTITGVVADKRSGRILYAIKTVDGKSIAKAIDSKLIQVFDEINEEQKARTARAPRGSKPTDEAVEAIVTEMRANYGRPIKFDGQAGRIHGVMLDKRSNNAMYRLKFDDESIKDRYCKANNTSLEILEADDTTADMQAKRAEYGTKGTTTGHKTSVEARLKTLCNTFSKTYKEYLEKSGAQEIEYLLETITSLAESIEVPAEAPAETAETAE